MLSTINAQGVSGDPSHSLHALACAPDSVIKIGRHPDSNVILEHSDFPFLISRRHAECVLGKTRVTPCTSVLKHPGFRVTEPLHLCRISIVDGKVSIVDTGSKNGV